MLTKLFGMNQNKIMEQITAIFGGFMVLFYLGAGIYLIFFFKNSIVDHSMLVIIGAAFIFYGIYRAFRTYKSVVGLFFKKDDDDDDY